MKKHETSLKRGGGLSKQLKLVGKEVSKLVRRLHPMRVVTVCRLGVIAKESQTTEAIQPKNRLPRKQGLLAMTECFCLLNKICRLGILAQQDKEICHAERQIDLCVSASQTKGGMDELFAKQTEKNYSQLTTHFSQKTAPILAFPRRGRKRTFTLAEVFSSHCAGRRKIAFTLAEVLITLGIIGVVAAILISPLISHYREKIIVSKLNNAYTKLLQASKQMLVDLNPDNIQENVWGEYAVKNFSELLPKYLNVSEVKRARTKACCYNRAGTGLGIVYSNGKIYALPSGGEVFLITDTKAGTDYLGCGQTTQYGDYRWFDRCGYMYIDVDGFNRGKNIFGYDVFYFYLTFDGILPEGMPKESIWMQKFDECLKDDSWYLGTCTAWVIYNKNMDYLHCPDKLGWNKQSSCKE